MKLRFTPRATENLTDIGNYLSDRNPAAARHVRAAIYEALQNLLLFPAAGRLQTVGRIRKLVTSKYAYLIYYLHDEVADEVVVLNIKHPARAREHVDR
ncbi:MAG TPA: type II toxin-antitoxin system RelE/ParE family toxin [Pseudolabrys sp.]|nr:type II toxin-antitoxin system RelE/ParE family toxin [Pseudolabrys sp.]